MLPHTKLGMFRVRILGMTAQDFTDALCDAGCPITLRRLRAIELREVKAKTNERLAIAGLLGVSPWEIQL